MARRRNDALFAQRQQEILRAAEHLFAERGFHGTGMATLCERLEMSPGTLYRYFPSKKEIIHAIVEEERVNIAQRLSGLSDQSPFLPALAEVLYQTIQEVCDPSYSRLALEIMAEGYRDPEVGVLFRAAEASLRERMAEVLRRAQAQGQVDGAVDPATGAQLLLTLVGGHIGTEIRDAGHLRWLLRRLVEGVLTPREKCARGSGEGESAGA